MTRTTKLTRYFVVLRMRSNSTPSPDKGLKSINVSSEESGGIESAVGINYGVSLRLDGCF